MPVEAPEGKRDEMGKREERETRFWAANGFEIKRSKSFGEKDWAELTRGHCSAENSEVSRQVAFHGGISAGIKDLPCLQTTERKRW